MDILAAADDLPAGITAQLLRAIPYVSVCAIGYIACQYHSTYVIASIAVVMWCLAKNRKQAYVFMLLYALFSTWVVVPAIIDYLDWHPALAVAFWWTAVPIAAAPWLLFYRRDLQFVELRLLIILAITWLPPLGAVQFASPFVGTSLLVPGLQWGSLIAGVVMVGGISRALRSRQISLVVLLIASAVALNLLSGARELKGWLAVDTAVSVGGLIHTIEGSAEALRIARKSALSSNAEVVVMGESTGGFSIDAGRRLLGSALEGTVVLAGGRVDEKQSLYRWNSVDNKIVYNQRLRPVLLEPFDGDLNGNRTVEIAGVRVAPLICYEGAVPYPITTALFHKPEAILSIANFSWSRNDAYFERVLRSHVAAWGRIWDIPTLVAVNSRDKENV